MSSTEYRRRGLIPVLLAALVALSLAPARPAEARRGFGGGFGRVSLGHASFGFGRRSLFGARRGVSSWGRRSERAPGGFGFGRASRRRWSGGNIERRVATKGNVFASRSQAEAAYRESLRTRWAREPPRRPPYVPRAISSGGRRYDVVFHDGKYGYWGPGRTWIALGAASMLMNTNLLARRGIYYAPAGRRRGAGNGMFTLLVIFCIIFVFVSLAGRHAPRR